MAIRFTEEERRRKTRKFRVELFAGGVVASVIVALLVHSVYGAVVSAYLWGLAIALSATPSVIRGATKEPPAVWRKRSLTAFVSLAVAAGLAFLVAREAGVTGLASAFIAGGGTVGALGAGATGLAAWELPWSD